MKTKNQIIKETVNQYLIESKVDNYYQKLSELWINMEITKPSEAIDFNRAIDRLKEDIDEFVIQYGKH